MSSVPQTVIKNKVGLLNQAAEPGNVCSACKVMVFPLDTSCRYQSAIQAGGVEVLIDANRKKPKVRIGVGWGGIRVLSDSGQNIAAIKSLYETLNRT